LYYNVIQFYTFKRVLSSIGPASFASYWTGSGRGPIHVDKLLAMNRLFYSGSWLAASLCRMNCSRRLQPAFNSKEYNITFILRTLSGSKQPLYRYKPWNAHVRSLRKQMDSAVRCPYNHTNKKGAENIRAFFYRPDSTGVLSLQ
jgi:hypothetical protein